MLRALIRFGMFVSFLVVTSGCATVQPWERGILAKKKMLMDADPETSALEQHVYEYREGTTGGYGSVGGGCGCN